MIDSESKDPPSNRVENFVQDTGDYIVWTTNLAPHKNVLLALEAIENYYNQGGKFKFIMTGVDTDKLDIKKELTSLPVENLEQLRQLIQSSSSLSKNLNCMGNISTADYLYILNRGKS